MPRGDGRLSHNLDPVEQGPQDDCGVFGVWARGEEVAKLDVLRPVRAAAPGPGGGRHRGQRRHRRRRLQGSRPGGPGLRRADAGEPARAHRGRPHPLLHHRLLQLGERAADAARDTARGRTSDAAPPRRSRWRTTATWSTPPSCAEQVGELGLVDDSTSDTALVASLLAARPDLSVEAAALEVLPTLRGAFSFVFMDEDTLYAARDPQGVRPLVLGRLERGWVVASETAALETVGAELRPRGRAGRADRHRRGRPALHPVRQPGAEGLSVRVRVPGPAGQRDRGAQHLRGPGRGRPDARPGASGRGGPRHRGAGVGHPGGDRLRRAVGHPVQRRAWSRTPTSGAPSSSPARPSASSASGSSSTRCARSCAASGS